LLLFSFCLPALAFCFVEAQNLLLLLLGEQWLDAVPLFQVLVIAVFVVSLYRVTKWLYVSAGQTQRQFRWGLIYTLVMCISMVIGASGGTYGIAVAYTLATCLLTYPAISYCLQTSPLSLRDFFTTVGRPAIAAILAACILFVSQFAFPLSTALILTLLIRSIMFAIPYILIWLALPGGWQTATNIWQNLKVLRSN
jgi:PST family polysaccharide transporter